MNTANATANANVDERIKCKYCDYDCKNQVTLNNHYAKYHTLKPKENGFHSCDYCDIHYQHKGALIKHKNKNHASLMARNIVAVPPPSPPPPPPSYHKIRASSSQRLYDLLYVVTEISVDMLRKVAEEIDVDLEELFAIHKKTVMEDIEDEIAQKQITDTYRGKECIRNGKKGFYRNLKYHEI